MPASTSLSAPPPPTACQLLALARRMPSSTTAPSPPLSASASVVRSYEHVENFEILRLATRFRTSSKTPLCYRSVFAVPPPLNLRFVYKASQDSAPIHDMVTDRNQGVSQEAVERGQV
ncbi:hypothetical protein D9619_004055 [Psilocybe cf. subviscida]|uniref:Uncharacterized protein n=1 Tax=Psilocybe cf. subviscida TaxID=2480587 RepID=A0A8H5F8U6_9AGAR|nr:hypothetical protein D9619_004055 [Psilocybe cf. subviscida]